jgi:hypothetical protein
MHKLSLLRISQGQLDKLMDCADIISSKWRWAEKESVVVINMDFGSRCVLIVDGVRYVMTTDPWSVYSEHFFFLSSILIDSEG